MKSNTGNRRELPLSGISSIYYDEFLRHASNPTFLLKIDENWNVTLYVAGTHTTPENWEITLYNGVLRLAEQWNVTTYTANLVHIQAGYTSVSEPWEISTYSLNQTISEGWNS